MGLTTGETRGIKITGSRTPKGFNHLNQKFLSINSFSGSYNQAYPFCSLFVVHFLSRQEMNQRRRSETKASALSVENQHHRQKNRFINRNASAFARCCKISSIHAYAGPPVSGDRPQLASCFGHCYFPFKVLT